MRIIGYGNATQEGIDHFEQHIGFTLPEDYRKFLLEYNGGVPKERYATFFIKELNQAISLHVLHGIGIHKLDLQKRNDEYWDDMLQKCIIIGDDPGSGMIVLINNDEYKGVYYWDHSYNFEQSNDECNIYKIVDNFQAFLDSLENPNNI